MSATGMMERMIIMRGILHNHVAGWCPLDPRESKSV